MIILDTSKGRHDVHLEFEGSPVELATEVCTLVSAVYHMLSLADKADGPAFRRLIQRLTRDESPVWEALSEEELELLKKKTPEAE